MSTFRHRIRIAVVLAFLTAPPLAVADSPAARPAQPTPEQVAAWVKQLGDNRFAAREEASKKLWAAGRAAESALEEAAKSDDAEVARRARDILAKFRWGIYPDTPADIVALIEAYQSTEGNARDEVLRKLLQAGPAGLQSVFKIYRAETDPARRNELKGRISVKLPASIPHLLTDANYPRFEALLEEGHASGIISDNHYTAYWLLRGKLDERIAHFRALLAKKPAEARHATTLAYLYRARGDLIEARKMAEAALAAVAKSGSPEVVERARELVVGLFYESADWKTLAARPDLLGADNGPNTLDQRIQKWAYRAAFARLAGSPKDCDAALAEISQSIDKAPDRDKEHYYFPAAKAYLLNDRREKGLDLLAKVPERQTVQFEILAAQLKYSEALKLADAPGPDGMARKTLEVLKARTLYLLGEKDRAQAIFARCGEQIKEGGDASWYESLLEAEYRVGLKDQAFEHCARALAVLHKNTPAPLFARTYLAKVFPDRTEAADVWWDFLRKKYPREATAAVLKRVRGVLAGKAAADEVKAWIEEQAGALNGLPVAESDRRLQALADAAVAANREELVRTLLEKAGTPAALIRLGDLLAAHKQWTQAAQRYRQAWQKSLEEKTEKNGQNALPGRDRHDPLPLYLAGWALVKAGQTREGEKLMEQSHWVPLGDAQARYSFLRALTQRGRVGGIDRETDLLWRVSEPNSFFSGEASRRRAVAAAVRKDYAKAADAYEQSMLRCLHTYTNFVQPAAYVGVPAQVHRMRAGALLAAGRIEDARKEIGLALAALPGSVELPIALVPELERRGHKKEAAELFERCVGAYEKLCQDYPRCSWAHNSAAWLSACCRRNLDKALAHARKAVELAPDNAGHLDTLAEVHFQRGDKDKAVALQKRVIELDPKKAYFRKQLKRIEAGDPSAPRPTEDEE